MPKASTVCEEEEKGGFVTPSAPHQAFHFFWEQHLYLLTHSNPACFSSAVYSPNQLAPHLISPPQLSPHPPRCYHSAVSPAVPQFLPQPSPIQWLGGAAQELNRNSVWAGTSWTLWADPASFEKQQTRARGVRRRKHQAKGVDIGTSTCLPAPFQPVLFCRLSLSETVWLFGSAVLNLYLSVLPNLQHNISLIIILHSLFSLENAQRQKMSEVYVSWSRLSLRQQAFYKSQLSLPICVCKLTYHCFQWGYLNWC